MQAERGADLRAAQADDQGGARVFEITVPTRRPGLAPAFQQVLAIEVAADTRLDQREQGARPLGLVS